MEISYLDLLGNVLDILHELLNLIKKNLREVCYQLNPFYRWANRGMEALIKLLIRDAFWWVYSCILSELCGKGHCLSRLMGKKTRFQFYLLKKKKKVCYMDLVNNVLGIVHALLHLIEKNLGVRCYQHSHFIEEETEPRGINKVNSKWKGCILVSVSKKVNVVGKGII